MTGVLLRREGTWTQTEGGALDKQTELGKMYLQAEENQGLLEAPRSQREAGTEPPLEFPETA